jgi:phosphoribosylformylglycinamidine synthase
MKNDSTMGGVKISIPPTLLFSVIAKIDDVTKAVTVDAKQPGALVYLLGITRDELGGSELARYLGGGLGKRVPHVDPSETIPLYNAVERAIREDTLQSCISPSRGGLAVALARTALGGRLGLHVDLDQDAHAASVHTAAALFGESTGRFVVTVSPANAPAFERTVPSGQRARIGQVVREPLLRIRHGGRTVVACELRRLEHAWKETLDAL